MSLKELNKLRDIVSEYPEIKLVYFFGSKAGGEGGPLSDYDFAVYVDERDTKKLYDVKLSLIEKISLLLKTDKLDIAIINLIESPELKYSIVRDGKLIFEQEPFKVIIEPRILNEYFDFHHMLTRYNLTQAQ